MENINLIKFNFYKIILKINEFLYKLFVIYKDDIVVFCLIFEIEFLIFEFGYLMLIIVFVFVYVFLFCLYSIIYFIKNCFKLV